MGYFYKIGDKVRILPINEAMSVYVFDVYQTGDLAELIDYDESGNFVSDEDDFFKSPQYMIKVFNDDEVVAWVFESMLAQAESSRLNKVPMFTMKMDLLMYIDLLEF